MTRKASLRDFEVLEDRSLPSTFGVPWADPTHLTLSFAPDGTATPLGPNSLSQTLARQQFDSGVGTRASPRLSDLGIPGEHQHRPGRRWRAGDGFTWRGAGR